jgi:hypothetical protein
LKGKNWENEVREAQLYYDFEYAVHSSASSPDGVVIVVENVSCKAIGNGLT